MPLTMSDPGARSVPRAFARWCVVVSLLVVLPVAGVGSMGGCSSMATIDARINNLMADKSERIGGDAYPPRVRTIGESGAYDGEMYEKNPATRNPAADELVYRGRGEQTIEEVLERFDRLAQPDREVLVIGLEDAFRIAQQTARDYLTAEEDYILTAIRLLIERHRWGPRFFDDVSFTFDGENIDGDYTAAANVINDLRVTQRLPYGGDVEAQLITRATRQLSNIVGDSYVASTELVLSANVPLLRDAGLIAQEALIQAERDLIYEARSFERFRRAFLVRVANEYFDLISQQNSLENSVESLEARRRNAERRQALVEAGRSPGSDAALAEQDVLRSLDSVNSARDALIVAKDRFKILLGLPMDIDIELEPVDLDIPDPDTDLVTAVNTALQYRLDYQNTRDFIADAQRNVKNSENQLLPDLNINGSVAIPTDSDDRVNYGAFDSDDARYNASITLGLPLDREIEKYNLRSAQIALQRSIRSADETRDNIILNVRQSVRRVDLARSSLKLQEESVRINERRLEELELRRETVDEQSIIDAQNDLLDSQNQLEAAIRELRNAILDYLLQTGQLRVEYDGTFRPLAGMITSE